MPEGMLMNSVRDPGTHGGKEIYEIRHFGRLQIYKREALKLTARYSSCICVTPALKGLWREIFKWFLLL